MGAKGNMNVGHLLNDIDRGEQKYSENTLSFQPLVPRGLTWDLPWASAMSCRRITARDLEQLVRITRM